LATRELASPNDENEAKRESAVGRNTREGIAIIFESRLFVLKCLAAHEIETDQFVSERFLIVMLSRPTDRDRSAKKPEKEECSRVR